MKPKEKMFIVRKYITASSAAQAIRRDKTHPVDDVWIDEEWRKNNITQLPPSVGFSAKG